MWGEFVDFGEHPHSVRTYKGQLELGQRSVSGMEIIQNTNTYIANELYHLIMIVTFSYVIMSIFKAQVADGGVDRSQNC